MTHKLYFRPETGCEDRIGKTYGPFEFLQLTYTELRISPNGDSAMFMDGKGKWFFASDRGWHEGHGLGVKAHPDDKNKWWSDIVIFESADVPEDIIAPVVQQEKPVVVDRQCDFSPQQVAGKESVVWPDHAQAGTPAMTYNGIIEWLAQDVLGSTEETSHIEANVDRYVEDLTKSIQAKAEELGV